MDIFDFFSKHGIAYERIEHEPVLTTEESERVGIALGGAGTKNLFVRDKKPRRHILIAVRCEKTVDLKAFKKLIECPSNLSIASDERLRKYLGVKTGAVSLLALINDPDNAVEVYIDEDLWHEDFIRCHPLVNTATIKIAQKDLERFFAILGHSCQVMRMPTK